MEIDLDNIDWALLREQKAALVADVTDLAEQHDSEASDRAGLLDGIVNFIDHIQDEAAKTLGIGTIFGSLDDTELVD